jgi:sugar phosphate isomerase/epimerase
VNTISFITANYVARELGYTMTEGWMQGDTATQNAFRPIETFSEKFGQMLIDIKNMGFDTIDLWGAHLHASWATAEHITIAKDLLAKHTINISSFAAWIGSVQHLKEACSLAAALNVPVIAGGAPALAEHRTEMVAILKDTGVKLGIENHPEKTPAEVLAQIGDGADGHIGTAPDTGWWGTQGYDAAKALRELKDHILAVHLKDVKASGAHETCRFGQGVVNIQACVQALKDIGYKGVIGIEHEPEHFDPTPDVIESRRMIEAWMK